MTYAEALAILALEAKCPVCREGCRLAGSATCARQAAARRMTIAFFVAAALYAIVQCIGAWKVHQRAGIARADRAERWAKIRAYHVPQRFDSARLRQKGA